MKIITYNIRSRERQIIATVTVIQGNGTARGIAIRSPLDAHNKEKAKNISMGRAFKCYYAETNICPFRDDRVKFQPVNTTMLIKTLADYEKLYLIQDDEGCVWKGLYNPTLSPHEENMLKHAVNV